MCLTAKWITEMKSEFIYGLTRTVKGETLEVEVYDIGRGYYKVDINGESEIGNAFEMSSKYPSLTHLFNFEDKMFDEYQEYGENNGPVGMSNPGDRDYEC